MNKEQKSSLIRQIIPAGLVPTAVGTGFLVMGSRDTKCFFALNLYLVTTGAISLSIPIMAVVFRLLLNKILEDGVVDSFESVLVTILRRLGTFVAFVEAAIVMAGTLVLLPNLPTWQHVQPDQVDTYCDLGVMMFALVFLAGSWLFIVIGTCIFMFFKFSNRGRGGRDRAD
jgi:hypothetical protein